MPINALITRSSKPRMRVDLLAQPQAHIQRHLLIAAAAGVDLVRQLADALFELADHQRVDVFVGSAVEKAVRCCASSRIAVKARRARRRAFLGRENAHALQRASESG